MVVQFWQYLRLDAKYLAPLEWMGQSTCLLDPTASPKTIDLIDENSHNAKAVGIYEIDGDHLRFCLTRREPALKNNQRPQRFNVPPGSAEISFFLERFRPPHDEEALNQSWDFVDETIDGKPVSAKALAARDGSFSNVMYLSINDTSPGRVRTAPVHLSYTLDVSTNPREITFFDGYYVEPMKMKYDVLPGIYKFDNDRLTIAYRKGGARPEKFESTVGSGVTLIVLRKTDPPKPTPSAGGPSMGGGMGGF